MVVSLRLPVADGEGTGTESFLNGGVGGEGVLRVVMSALSLTGRGLRLFRKVSEKIGFRDDS